MNKSGFGLVEVMLAVVIAGISFCGIYVMSIQSLRILRMAQNEAQSLQVAQHELEKIRSSSWSAILAMGSSYSISASNNPALSQLAGYSAKVEINSFPPAGTNNNMRTVTVYVSWWDPAGLRITNSMTSLVARKGMLK